MQKAIHLLCIILVISLLSTARLSAQERATIFSVENKWYPFVNIDTGTINRQMRYAYSTYPYKNIDSALMLYRNIYSESKSINYTEGIIVALANIAGCYLTQGSYNTGIEYYRLALNNVTKDYANHTKIAVIYSHMSAAYFFQGKYDTTAYLMYKALGELEHNKITNYAEAIHIYTNVADLLKTLDENTNALYYIRKAEAMALEHKDTGSLAGVYVCKAGAFLDTRQWDSARYYCNQILKVNNSRQKLFLYNYRKANQGLGYSYVQQSPPEPQKAIPYLQEALRLSREGHDQADIPGCYYHLGLAYYQLHDLDRAEKIMLEVSKEAEAFGDKDRILYAAHNYLADIYRQRGDYQKAFTQLAIYKKLEDNVITMDKLMTVNRLDVKYRVAEKDKALMQNNLLLLKQQDKIKEKNYWIAGISILVLLVVIVFLSLFRINQHKQKISTLNAILQGEENERTRLARELHDGIGGMLAAIKMNFGALKKRHVSLAGSDDFDETLSMLHTTWTEVRETAHNLMPDILVKHGLTEALHMYCEKINNGNGLYIDLQLNGNLEDLNKSFELTAYRIIQELVQNIVKHSVAHNALVQISRKDDVLSILVEDNGEGFDSTDPSMGGIGLQNVRYRVEALHGEMSLQSAPAKGTLVYIKFYLKKNKHIQLHENPISNS